MGGLLANPKLDPRIHMQIPPEEVLTGRPSWVPESMPGFTFEFDPIYYLKIRKSFQVDLLYIFGFAMYTYDMSLCTYVYVATRTPSLSNPTRNSS